MTEKIPGIRSAVIAAAMLAVLAACATVPQIRTQSAPELDLGRYTTYSFVEHPGTDRGNYRSITTRYLEAAVDHEMAARGFTQSAHPQLLIDFHTMMRDRLRGQMGPYWGGGWGYGWGWGWGWGPGWWGGPPGGPWGLGGWNDIEAYTEGTLTIDVIDAMDKDAIWSGSAVSRVQQAALQHPKASIDETVASIFAQFPKQPLRSAQSPPNS
ncbi:MAG: DUF4136 domain-containing protein [Steroidobacteraceae bacterium]